MVMGKLPDKSTISLNKRVIKMIQRSGLKFKTITVDNGTDFHQYKEVEKACKVSFTLPHSTTSTPKPSRMACSRMLL